LGKPGEVLNQFFLTHFFQSLQGEHPIAEVVDIFTVTIFFKNFKKTLLFKVEVLAEVLTGVPYN